jgi:hypothetical protein
VTLALLTVPCGAEDLDCDMTGYRAASGLTAVLVGDALTATWDGDRGQEVRIQFGINDGTPTIRELSVRRKGGRWITFGRGMTPDYRVVSGIRRVTTQQLFPLRQLGVELTQEILDRIKWEAFWDAPLNVPGDSAAHRHATPPLQAFLNYPGLPRLPEEVQRATAIYAAHGCTVTTNGARLEIVFPGLQLGVFSGHLDYTLYKGTNLIRQAVVAQTDKPSVAYKYDAGWKGLPVDATSRISWRTLANAMTHVALSGASVGEMTPLKAGNRLAVADGSAGSIATFPPPHTFFWAREVETNLGYVWYRRDSAASFSLGVRQAESEGDSADSGAGDIRQNFALYSARPHTWQRMPVYFYVSVESAQATLQSALAFTRDDRFKSLPGFQVMATHFHSDLVERLREARGSAAMLPDFELMKSAGVNIFAPIDGAGRDSTDRLQGLADYYAVARSHSDKRFLIMPNEEDLEGYLGGHADFLVSKPLYWKPAKRGDAFVEEHPIYGRVYNVANRMEVMEMARREGVLIFMPHPRSKGSTGFPDAIRAEPHFRHASYRGIGFRWGMGLDGSETRLCEYRCLPTLDDMNNWVADDPTPPKYLLAISETYRKAIGDDIYANNPVNYLKLDRLPGPDDWSPVVDVLRRGDYFVTSGEVLIPRYIVEGTGNQRMIVAEVEWTFPLEFAEVVWGDGESTYREIIPATQFPPFGRHRFEIPFNAAGRKWMRFAVWDSAGNGALVQPVRLGDAAIASSGR